MKKSILIMFLVSSSFAFDLGLDTINVEESLIIHNTSASDSLRLDSAVIDLIQSDINQYQLIIICPSESFYLSNHVSIHGDGSLDEFQLEIAPNDSIVMYIEGLDYCLLGCIPEDTGPVIPPKPMIAKMTVFSNRGKDSIIINGMQTCQPLLNKVSDKKRHVGQSKKTEKYFYAINGRLIRLHSTRKHTHCDGIVIAAEKFNGGKTVYLKKLPLH